MDSEQILNIQKQQDIPLEAYIGLTLVGLIWGITNPFMEKGVKEQKSEPLNFSWKSFLQLFLKIKVLMPFVVNQLGSVLFYYVLGKTPISIGQTIANSLTTIITLITESILNKQKPNLKTLLGLSLVLLGIYLTLS